MHAAAVIRRLFALPERTEAPPPVPADAVNAAWPEPGEITLITGGSGGGKSRLLAALRDRGGASVRWIEPHTIPLGDACVVDLICDELEGEATPVASVRMAPIDSPSRAVRLADHEATTGHNVESGVEPSVEPRGDPQAGSPTELHAASPAESHIEAALELLSRVGLAEAWTYLQKPAELSDGQRWRLLLALAVARGMRQPAAPCDSSARQGDWPHGNASSHAETPRPQSPVITIIAIDEFAAMLDRVTARIVARALRRLIDRPGRPPIAAIVVTSHDDLRIALSPDRKVFADFGVYQSGDAAPAYGAVKYRKRHR